MIETIDLYLLLKLINNFCTILFSGTSSPSDFKLFTTSKNLARLLVDLGEKDLREFEAERISRTEYSSSSFHLSIPAQQLTFQHLPLSFIFLAHIQISQLIFFKIVDNQDALYFTRSGTPKYDKLSDNISSEWTAFWLFKFAYFTFLLILSLLSTSAVVYTIACKYTAKPITFRKIMSVVPKVWKRLVVTFICSFVVVVIYNIIAAVVFLTLWTQVVYHVNSSVGFRIAVLVVLIIVYSVGMLYITILWHLASVVSVLEDFYGIKAMIKSKNLIKGQMGVAAAIFIVVGVCFAGIQLLYEIFVVFHNHLGVRIGAGIICFLLLCKVMLFVLVIQTVLYFVCKSYHHENISKSSLSDHLEVYLGHYVALESKDVQMEQFQA